MKGIINALRTHGRRAAIFLVGSIVAQGLTAVIGLLLAHWLDVRSYAIYTIFTIVVGAIAILTKGGAQLGFSSILGKVWPDGPRAGLALKAAVSVRLRVSMFMMPILLVTTIYLLYENDASYLEIALILLCIIAIWASDMSVRLSDQILNFAHETTKQQVLATVLAVLRICMIALMYISGILGVAMAAIVNALAAVARVPFISTWVKRHTGPVESSPIPEDTKIISLALKRQMPVDIYYVLQAQIVLVLLSYFGSTSEVAGYGALGRISQLLVPVQSFTYAFCIPIFTRSSGVSTSLLLRLSLLTALPGVALVIIALMAPNILLLLVGSQYASLQFELFVATLTALVVTTSDTFWRLLANKGFVRFSWMQIPLGGVWCMIAAQMLDFTSISAAFILLMGFAFVKLLTALIELSLVR